MRQFASAAQAQPIAATRSFSGLSFVILLSAGFWTGALWLTRVVVQVAAGG